MSMAKRHQNQQGNLESLFLRMEELVLANSGEDEFEEVFKLLVAKLWDERSQQSKFYRYSTDEATFEAIAKLMREAEKKWSGILNEVTPKLTPEHLSICVDALSRHNISNESLDVIDGFFEFIVSKSAKGAKGQYFTPRHVVELCVRILKPSSGETILDPACGSGGFLLHAFKFIKQHEKLDSEGEIQGFCSEKLWGFDIDTRATRVAKALMILAGDGSSNIIRLNSLLKTEMIGIFGDTEEPNLTVEDVCRSRIKRHKGFDVILTNPPFAGEIREASFLNCYDLANKKSRIERDILFIERCLELLRPGGRLAIVLPHNKFAGKSFEFLRQWIFTKARILAVIGLGRNTFMPHTHQKASILILKKQSWKSIPSDYNIFFAISEKDGKNSKGQFILHESVARLENSWEDIDHDFSEVVEGFETFLKQENIDLE